MPTREKLRSLLLALCLAAVLVGVLLAAADPWVCDDAFISFRYASNLVAGNGLVFNVGERVEGFSNLLWTLWLALGLRLGFEPVSFAHVSGVACFAATIALLFRVSRRIAPAGSVWVPVAAVAFALHPHARQFASGGLETALITLLVTALLIALVEARSARGYALSGVLATLAILTRPDAALFGAIAAAVAVLDAREHRTWRPLLAFAAPIVFVLIPILLWKWSYYGYPFPNTFYAKSAAVAYPGQGAFYVGLYFSCYFVLLLGIVGALIGSARATQANVVRERRANVIVLAFIGSYTAFVVWVGGDFMFARFMLPITPALLLGIEFLRRRWSGPAFGLALLLITTGGVLARSVPDGLHALPGVRGVLEERSIYPARRVEYNRQAGALLREKLAGLDARVAIGGGQAMLAYYAQFPVAIECATGLTDEHLAHLELPERSRIGHEKGIQLDPAYLDERGVQFWFVPVSAVPYITQPHVDFGNVSVFGELLPVRAVSLSRDPPLLAALFERGVVSCDVER